MGGTLTRYEPTDSLIAPPRPNQGPIQAMFTRARASRSAQTTEAMVPLVQAHTALTTAHTALVEAQHKDFEAMCRLNEAPEKFAHELQVRRAQRSEEIRQVQHRYQANEIIREQQITDLQTELVHKRVALADAHQQLRAQHEHGYLRYELAHKRQALEILDIDLNQAERRALFREHEGRRGGPVTLEFDEDIQDALYDRRERLNAAGLDTSRIDSLMRDRKR